MLSKRLKVVAGMVTEGNTIADIGTDHGYVPIYLVKNNICPKAYAMDINQGPIESAIKNIEAEGLSDKIVAIKSNGLAKFEDNMAQSVVIAGMGGDLIIEILLAAKNLDTIEELILSPHKRVDLVRRFLHKIGWKIVKEDMLIDASKFYTVLKAVKGKDVTYTDEEYEYGKILLEEKNQDLKLYLEKEYNKFMIIRQRLINNGRSDVSEVDYILEINEKGRARYD